ncbi:MAG: hypothetical protein KA284_12705 [Bacteroidia bacterium]|nr:hypothetical protein [Bacteroidia bacterium]
MNSKQAHEDLKKSGRKEALHMQIMRYLYRYSDATFSEVAKYYERPECDYWRRFNELMKAGLIIRTNKSRNSLTTGKKLTVWALK